MNLPNALAYLDTCTAICGAAKEEVRGLLYAFAGKRRPVPKPINKHDYQWRTVEEVVRLGKPKLGAWVRFTQYRIVNGTGRVVAQTGAFGSESRIVVAFPRVQHVGGWLFKEHLGAGVARRYGYRYGWNVEDGHYQVIKTPRRT